MAMERKSLAEQSAEKETGRVESFSDGVFSVAMTLLIVELKVPPLPRAPSSAVLLHELARQWPSYFAFVTSFFTVLIMWVNHHGIFRMIRRTDTTLLLVNGFLLLLVTAVPFPTAVVATYLRTPAAPVACAVYGGLFVVVSLSYAMLLHVALRGGNLLYPGTETQVRRRLRDCYRVGFPLYLLSTVMAFYSPLIALGICSALWVFWCFVGSSTAN